MVLQYLHTCFQPPFVLSKVLGLGLEFGVSVGITGAEKTAGSVDVLHANLFQCFVFV